MMFGTSNGYSPRQFSGTKHYRCIYGLWWNAESSTLPPGSGSHSLWLLLGAIHWETQQLERATRKQTNHLHNQLIATFNAEQSAQKENKLRTAVLTRLF